MRVINVILVKHNVVVSVQSFGIIEEQQSSEVVEQAENAFKEEVFKLTGEPNLDEFEDNFGAIESFIEDGAFYGSNASVSIVWPDVEN